jgi:hypothetical protein
MACRSLHFCIAFFGAIVFLDSIHAQTPPPPVQTPAATAPNKITPVEKRVADLLKRMTLE